MLRISPDWQLITNLIGKPYAFPSYPPKSFDCFTITVYLRELLFNLPTPHVTLSVDEAKVDYEELEKPEEGCIVSMTDKHIGVYINGRVITALEKRGVCALHWKTANAIYRVRCWEVKA